MNVIAVADQLRDDTATRAPGTVALHSIVAARIAGLAYSPAVPL